MALLDKMQTADRMRPDVDGLRGRYRRAVARRQNWQRHWQECYEFALPQRGEGASGGSVSGASGASGGGQEGNRRFDRVFDATAPDAVEQLAASLLAEITPPGGGWFDLECGAAVPENDRAVLADSLAQAVRIIDGHFERSNFSVEIHQAFLDLVTVGTACLRLEESPFGTASALRFASIPVRELAFEERADGALDAVFRKLHLGLGDIRARWPDAPLPDGASGAGNGAGANGGDAATRKWSLIEAVLPVASGTGGMDGAGGYDLAVFYEDGGAAGGDGLIAVDRFAVSPYIAFRWLKAPGEIYGRSPVMKALPDIKTANKVVELILKNASIAVTGIWQADDDGILNPATVRLVPGSIIPKAVGSAGLKPLDAPGRFDVSDLVLQDLRDRIRRCLLADRLTPMEAPRMTATEVLERAAENSRLLGATYGRLQAELLFPLMRRAVHILTRRGVLPEIPLEGDVVRLRHAAPMAQLPRRVQAAQTLDWLIRLGGLGPDAMARIDLDRTVGWLAEQFGVPEHLLRPVMPEMPDIAIADIVTELAGMVELGGGAS
ncbi:portal protein [Thalassospira sp.]|uniref:portal protein n=1 Tax=Thalassospira sp. TaxID=1912094 RepID=UPI0027358067|nr:portal protein [Thalassospira sp.]MDP2697593.1 portal protein [Thalassospira sp.]